MKKLQLSKETLKVLNSNLDDIAAGVRYRDTHFCSDNNDCQTAAYVNGQCVNRTEFGC